MQYLGGKSKIAKPLAAYLESRREGRYFVEPFCGALNVTAAMSGPRLACDASPYLFSLYARARTGWEPPTVTEELYQQVKAKKDPSDPLTALCGYGASFGGKFFAGAARSATRGVGSYAAQSFNSLKKKLARCNDATFGCCSYERLNTAGCLVYCDPPYANTTDANTTGYAAVAPFDHAAFWHWVRAASKQATALVSEYTAPADFRCVWETQAPGDMQGKDKATGRTERLFEYAP